jgi:hypothetical protein
MGMLDCCNEDNISSNWDFRVQFDIAYCIARSAQVLRSSMLTVPQKHEVLDRPNLMVLCRIDLIKR